MWIDVGKRHDCSRQSQPAIWSGSRVIKSGQSRCTYVISSGSYITLLEANKERHKLMLADTFACFSVCLLFVPTKTLTWTVWWMQWCCPWSPESRPWSARRPPSRTRSKRERKIVIVWNVPLSRCWHFYAPFYSLRRSWKWNGAVTGYGCEGRENDCHQPEGHSWWLHGGGTEVQGKLGNVQFLCWRKREGSNCSLRLTVTGQALKRPLLLLQWEWSNIQEV